MIINDTFAINDHISLDPLSMLMVQNAPNWQGFKTGLKNFLF